MRIDKLTTKFQEAIAEAQSLAVGQDHQYIEPQHLLAALLAQDDGSTGSLIQQAGGNPGALRSALQQAIGRLPRVEGTPGEVSLSRDLSSLLNVADKEAQQRGDREIEDEEINPSSGQEHSGRARGRRGRGFHGRTLPGLADALPAAGACGAVQ